MPIIAQSKEITVEQYEFYKTKENPMTDAQIIKIYGLDGNKLYAWKKKNDLIGKTYAKKEESNLKVYQKFDEMPAPEPEDLSEEKKPLLKENDIAKERALKAIEDYEANKKVQEKIKERSSEDAVDALSYSLVNTQRKETATESFDDVKAQLETELNELRKEKNWLEEQHVKDTAEKDSLRDQLEQAKLEEKYFALILKVSEEVKAERFRQINQYGNQRHDHGVWLTILTEEFGEVAQAMQKERGWGKETDADDLYKELTHVAAVALAFAEQVLEEREEGSSIPCPSADDAIAN